MSSSSSDEDIMSSLPIQAIEGAKRLARSVGGLSKRQIIESINEVKASRGRAKVLQANVTAMLTTFGSTVEIQKEILYQSLDEEFGIPAARTPGVKKKLLTYDGYVTHHYDYMAKVVQDVESTCFEDAIDNENWKNAMDEEMTALDVDQTWEMVPLPEGNKAIECKWVYKVKHKVDGTFERYTARLVAKRYAQTYGINYEETFALVAKMATVCTIIVMVAAKGWFMHQMDVKNAILQGELQEEVYVEQPPGNEDGKHLDYVCHLCKALYGLKQEPRAWHDNIAKYLMRIGFCMSHIDHSLYVRQSNARFVLITIYADDLIIMGDNEIEIEHVKSLLKKELR
ncbi:hypothetical protein L7F22_001770 [Adiantum nelumboides]|nr:hypothetical protein [Adiantum nelumboides]